jgi:hypothetical protein
VSEFVSWLVSRVHLRLHRQGRKLRDLTPEETFDEIDDTLWPRERRTIRQKFLEDYQNDVPTTKR